MNAWGDSLRSHPDFTPGMARTLDIAVNYFGGRISRDALFIASCTSESCDLLAAAGYMVRRRFGWSWTVTPAGYRVLAEAARHGRPV